MPWCGVAEGGLLRKCAKGSEPGSAKQRRPRSNLTGLAKDPMRHGMHETHTLCACPLAPRPLTLCTSTYRMVDDCKPTRFALPCKAVGADPTPPARPGHSPLFPQHSTMSTVFVQGAPASAMHKIMHRVCHVHRAPSVQSAQVAKRACTKVAAEQMRCASVTPVRTELLTDKPTTREAGCWKQRRQIKNYGGRHVHAWHERHPDRDVGQGAHLAWCGVGWYGCGSVAQAATHQPHLLAGQQQLLAVARQDAAVAVLLYHVQIPLCSRHGQARIRRK